MHRRSFIKQAGMASLSGSIAAAVWPSSNARAAENEGARSGSANLAGASVENVVFPAQAAAVIDVTKAPYFCDSRGTVDCTAALIRALDDLVRPTLLAQQALVREMEADPRPDYMHPRSRENRKEKGVVTVIFPARPSPSKILYFPNGTYLVSDTLCYTFTDLHNSQRNELNRQIIIRGQSEHETVILLKDRCAGFEAGANKPVFSFIRKSTSNVAMANYFENITINTGAGNPGASGLRFFSNNSGAVRQVSIFSGDPARVGSVGILCDRSNFSGSYFKHVTIEGFDYGVQVLPHKMYAVFEHIELRHQAKAGFLVDETPVTIRGLKSLNAVPALLLSGQAGHVTLLDGHLVGAARSRGTAIAVAAIEQQHGVLFARNIKVSGYPAAVGRFGAELLPGRDIEEYSSHGVVTAFHDQPKRSLNLPIEETPSTPWEQDMTQWVSVNGFGATGDGVTDDTAAIQAALNSGKRVIYFQPGRYLLNAQLRVPGTVTRINFMFCDLMAGEALRAMSGRGTFKVDGFSSEPLLMEDLLAFEEYRGQQYFIEHASKRTLVLSDLHTQIGAMYLNSVEGGKVFIENVACTDEFEPNPNCYRFRGQQVWARQLNPERANPQVINEGSQLWVLGFKAEGKGVGFHTSAQGSTEILGGVVNFGGDAVPFIVNDNANVSVTCAARGKANTHRYKDFAVEKRAGAEGVVRGDQLPKRILFLHSGTKEYDSYAELYFVPLYVGRQKP